MSKKKYNLVLGISLRFLRTVIPQLVILIPLLIKYAEQLPVPVWTLPVLACVGAVVTALDKLRRELAK